MLGLCKCASHASSQNFSHRANILVIAAEDVAKLMHDNTQKVHAIDFALVARMYKFRIIGRGRVDEPAPAGRIVVEPNRSYVVRRYQGSRDAFILAMRVRRSVAVESLLRCHRR